MEPATLLDKYAQAREAYYRSLKTFEIYERGWLRRNDEVLEKAKSMVVWTGGSQMKFDKRVSPQKSNDWYKKVSRRFIDAYSCNQPKFSSITDVWESNAVVPKLV